MRTTCFRHDNRGNASCSGQSLARVGATGGNAAHGGCARKRPTDRITRGIELQKIILPSDR